jgi:hypothetical protein
MMPEPPEPQIDVLDAVVAALLRGDWRTAKVELDRGVDAAGRRDLVAVAFCLRCVTRCMQFQSVHGDVEAASHQLDAAARKLTALPAGALSGGRTARLRRTATQLVERERADLDAVRLIFEGLPRGRQELVHATVEYLTLVEFDPWTVRIHPRDQELTGLDDDAYGRLRTGNRRDICDRASRLRQFANVRSGSVSERTWQRTGGYPGLREHALRRLAQEPLTRGRADLPVRLGRRRAWDYACAWVRDTAA